MELLTTPLSVMEISMRQEWIENGFFYFSLGFLAFEFVRCLFLRKMSLAMLGDAVTSFITLAMFIGITVLIAGIYVTGFFHLYRFALFDIGINWATILICVVLADLAYYWEHRFMHRMNLAWATHSVHHSSPYMNISVAYRFGPMDGIWPFVFHAPLVMIGFHPFVVFMAEALVQLYQTALHTEAVGKLPKPVEAVMNTPSHHRVHHGSNPQYIDRNYAGIFIVWDRLFGTFAKEESDVIYGLTEPVRSSNPLVVFCHGFTRLADRVARAGGPAGRIACLFAPPPGVADSGRIPGGDKAPGLPE